MKKAVFHGVNLAGVPAMNKLLRSQISDYDEIAKLALEIGHVGEYFYFKNLAAQTKLEIIELN